MPPSPFTRIMVMGPPGSGKSTLARLLRRIATGYGRVRPDSAPGCPENIDFAFLRYAWTWPHAVRPRILAAIDGRESQTTRLTDPASIAALVERLSPPARASVP